VETPPKKLSLLRPVRLRLEVPLEGPYIRLLRRPSPEVAALAAGECLAIVRGTRIRQAVPFLPASVSCYYGRGGGRRGLEPEDFQDPEKARHILAAGDGPTELRYLAVPVGHVRLPNERWISRLTAQLTPWREEAVERWRRGVERSIWLSALRVYEFEPLSVEPSPGPQPRVKPFRALNLRPVLDDGGYARALDELLATVEHHQERKTARFARGSRKGKEGEEAEGKPPMPSAYPLEEMAEETGFGLEQLRQWLGWLQRKKQVILYGPPGTGKTYLAERLARCLTGGTPGFHELVQFHPSYAYEDFVQGIRPRTERGSVVYELASGRFLEFCRRARRAGESPCALVIDEINRAHLSRVFGELMYLLEYRDRAIPLAAGGRSFKIPRNVYLIGTMNTADRSIALVDQALRRRFAFIRLRPEYEVLTRFLEKRGFPPADLLGVLKEINQSVDHPDHELGISFFLDEDLRMNLPQIWRGEVEPYLEEVFYDRPERMEEFRWEALAAGRLKEWA